MSNLCLGVTAAHSMSARLTPLLSMQQTANLPNTRQHENFLEETMIHDLYLMNANASLEAAANRKFEHRTLTFDEMAASCKRRGAKSHIRRTRSMSEMILLALVKGVVRT